jgi:hypothetical protein
LYKHFKKSNSFRRKDQLGAGPNASAIYHSFAQKQWHPEVTDALLYVYTQKRLIQFGSERRLLRRALEMRSFVNETLFALCSQPAVCINCEFTCL